MIKKCACESCNKRNVCKYVEEYIAAQEALENLTYSVDKIVTKIEDSPFIVTNMLKCKYYAHVEYDGTRGV